MTIQETLRSWADLEHEYSHDDEAVLRGAADRLDALEAALRDILRADEEAIDQAWWRGQQVLDGGAT